MPIFREDADYWTFLRQLESIATQFPIAIHNFALMTTHYHLLVTPPDQDKLARAMKALAWRYSVYFNERYDRCGTLWGERYQSAVVDTEEYMVRCMRYIEQNPVRAAIVERADDYRWSSFAAYGNGRAIDWLTPHPVYEGLGQTADERRQAYRAICGVPLTDEELVSMRTLPVLPSSQGPIGDRHVPDTGQGTIPRP